MIHLDKSLLKASLIVSKTLKRRLSHQDLNPFIEPKKNRNDRTEKSTNSK